MSGNLFNEKNEKKEKFEQIVGQFADHLSKITKEWQKLDLTMLDILFQNKPTSLSDMMVRLASAKNVGKYELEHWDEMNYLAVSQKQIIILTNLIDDKNVKSKNSWEQIVAALLLQVNTNNKTENKTKANENKEHLQLLQQDIVNIDEAIYQYSPYIKEEKDIEMLFILLANNMKKQ